MTEPSEASPHFRDLIERLADGDDSACGELINESAARVTALTKQMFKDYHRLGRWEQTEDICQNASVRLWNALRATRPATAAEFYRLAALQVRRELIDQVRRYFGPEGLGANHESHALSTPSTSDAPPAYDTPQSTLDPASLARWAEFHERVADLPEEERAVFDLVWYQGLNQADAAALLGISERTLKRRWLAARLFLGRVLGGEPIV